MERLEEGFPPKSAFYNTLTKSEVKDNDYTRARKLFYKLGFKTLKQWAELYVQLDSNLLCDVFSEFRKLVQQLYGLEALAYISIPGLALDAALKTTKINLELVSDSTLYMFFEKYIRGEC